MPAPTSDAARAAALRAVCDAVVVDEVVKRVAWGGDRRRGVARIELGGAYEGTSIVVEGEGVEVRVDVELAPGVEAGELPARLAARLRERGLALRAFEVR